MARPRLSTGSENMGINSDEYKWMTSLRVVIVAWLSASHISRVDVGMDLSAGGWDVNRFEQFVRPDIALYKNLPVPRF